MGNILCATGFDVVLKGVEPSALTADLVADKIKVFVDAAKEARDKAYPALKNHEQLSDADFAKALPNYCGNVY